MPKRVYEYRQEEAAKPHFDTGVKMCETVTVFADVQVVFLRSGMVIL